MHGNAKRGRERTKQFLKAFQVSLLYTGSQDRESWYESLLPGIPATSKSVNMSLVARCPLAHHPAFSFYFPSSLLLLVSSPLISSLSLLFPLPAFGHCLGQPSEKQARPVENHRAGFLKVSRGDP